MRFTLTLQKYDYRLIKFDCLDSTLKPLLNNILTFEGGILSLTLTADEISLIIRDDIFSEQFQNVNVSGNVKGYRAAIVETDNPGLNETGILAEITKKMADAEVSILCFSTYNYNFILYPEEDHQKVTKMINIDEDLTLSV